MPGLDAGVVLGQIAGLPHQVRQARRKVHAVLAGAATDFQHVGAAGQGVLQHGQDRGLVVGAGGGEDLAHTAHLGTKPSELNASGVFSLWR